MTVRIWPVVRDNKWATQTHKHSPSMEGCKKPDWRLHHWAMEAKMGIWPPNIKPAKLFYSHPNKPKSKHVLKLGTHKLSTWIKSITGHNNLAYSQSKINPEIDPTCRLCWASNETIHHLLMDCEVMTPLQLRIMKSKVFLTWPGQSKASIHLSIIQQYINNWYIYTTLTTLKEK